MRMVEQSANLTRPRLFGRAKSPALLAAAAPSRFADDLRLFALTFAGGFLFMTIFLA